MSFRAHGPVTIRVGDLVVGVGEACAVGPLPSKRDPVACRVANDYSVMITLPLCGVIYTAGVLTGQVLDKHGKPVA